MKTLGVISGVDMFRETKRIETVKDSDDIKAQIMQQLKTMMLGSGDAVEVDQRWGNMLSREIQAAEVDLVVELASAQLTISQLLAIRPGDFIELQQPQMVTASVGGVPVVECHYGTHNGKYAIRVERSLGVRETTRFGV